MPRLDAIDRSRWQSVIIDSLPAGIGFASQVGWRNDLLSKPGVEPKVYERDLGLMNVDPSWSQSLVHRTKRPNDWRWHYLVPVNRPWKDQLDKFLATIGPLPKGEGVMFDLEYSHAKELGWTNLKAMMDECEQRIGRPVLHYGELFMHLDPGRPKWVADYRQNTAQMEARYPFPNRAIWQWTGSGTCPGVAGAVDCNEYLDLSLVKATLGVTSVPTMNPKATPKLLSTWDVKNGAKRRSIRPRVIVLHTNAAGSAVSLQSNWTHANEGGTQAHFQIQGGFHSDGTIGAWQFLPTDREGVGSWNGDSFGITIETQDDGATPLEKLRTTPWTAAQVEAIAQVCAVECQRWGIPVRVADKWDGSGIGWHRQWGVNSRSVTSKGEGLPVGSLPGYVNPWTMTSGKTCPENARIAQVPAIVARVAQIIAGQNPPDMEEDMTPAQADQLAAVNAKVAALFSHFDPDAPGPAAGQPDGRGYWQLHALRYSFGLDSLAGSLAALIEKVDALAEKVDALEPGDSAPVVFPNYGPITS